MRPTKEEIATALYESSPEFLAAEIARQEREGGGDAQQKRKRHRLEAIANEFKPPALVRTLEAISKRRGEIAELEGKESAILSAMGTWNRLLDSYEDLELRIQTAKSQCFDLEALRARLDELTYEREITWGAPVSSGTKWCTAAGLAELHGLHAGAERALAAHPEWLKRQLTRLAALEAEILTMAKAHGLSDDQLPASLQKR